MNVNSSDRIDVHSHIYPKSFLEVLESNGQLSRRTGQIEARENDHPNSTRIALFPAMWDSKLRIKVMRRLGVRMQIISIGTPWLNCIPPARSKAAARSVNSAVAEMVRSSPRRFAGLGVLAVNSPGDGIEEIDYALDELGLKGFIVSSHVNGRPIFDGAFSSLLNHCAKRSAPVFIHPIAQPDSKVFYLPAMTSIHFTSQTSTAAFGLMASGFFRRNPRAKILLSHVGGVIPFILGRLSRDAETFLGDRKLRDGIFDAARFFYIDTLSYYTPALDFAIREWSPRKVMFGTDYPYAWGDDPTKVVQVVNDTETTNKERSQIFSENAVEFFNV